MRVQAAEVCRKTPEGVFDSLKNRTGIAGPVFFGHGLQLSALFHPESREGLLSGTFHQPPKNSPVFPEEGIEGREDE